MVEVANGGSIQVPSASKGNAPRLPSFHGVRNAREIDNFLCGLEASFEAMGIEDDAQKVSSAAFLLKDIALIWRRRRCDNANRGSDPINTWDEFKRQLKRQFYFEGTEYKARAKLRRLQHKDGHIREHIKEFQEPLLEIPRMEEHDALFYFLDGLHRWAKMELKKHRVQDLS